MGVLLAGLCWRFGGQIWGSDLEQPSAGFFQRGAYFLKFLTCEVRTTKSRHTSRTEVYDLYPSCLTTAVLQALNVTIGVHCPRWRPHRRVQRPQNPYQASEDNRQESPPGLMGYRGVYGGTVCSYSSIRPWHIALLQEPLRDGNVATGRVLAGTA